MTKRSTPGVCVVLARVTGVPGSVLRDGGVGVVEQPLVAPLESAAVQAMVETIDRQLAAHRACDSAGPAADLAADGSPALVALASMYRANRGALLAHARAVLTHSSGSP